MQIYKILPSIKKNRIFLIYIGNKLHPIMHIYKLIFYYVRLIRSLEHRDNGKLIIIIIS